MYGWRVCVCAFVCMCMCEWVVCMRMYGWVCVCACVRVVCCVYAYVWVSEWVSVYERESVYTHTLQQRESCLQQERNYLSFPYVQYPTIESISPTNKSVCVCACMYGCVCIKRREREGERIER